MKKSLFYSVAIAAVMASCTQEVIDVPSNNVQDLSIRPTLGEIALVEDAGVQSRFAAGAGARPEFAENDQIGAAIMDAPLYPAKPYNEKDKAANYSIVEYYSSNSAFSKEGDAWYLNEDQPLVEGNYLFYAPYNQAMQLRTPFEVRVPQKQTADTDKAALNEYYASGAVVRIGHNFLAAENGKAQRPSVKFFDIMSYPKFVIANNFDGYTIQKGEDEEGNAIETIVEYTGAMKVDSIQLVFNNEQGKGVVIGGLLSNNKLANSLRGWVADPRDDKTTDLLNEKATIETYSTITTLVANGREIKKGEEAVFYAVMPATQYQVGELKANVYVTIGEKQYVISTANFMLEDVSEEDAEEPVYEPVYEKQSLVPGHTFATTTGTITMLPGQSYPQEELNYENGKFTAKKIYGRALKIVLEGGKVTEDDEEAKTLQVAQEITLEETEEGGETSTDLIDNNEEFIQFFKDMESGSNLTENEEAEIDYENAKFAFSENTTATINKELIDALCEYTYRGSIKINKSLVIANDVKVIAINGTKVKFQGSSAKQQYEIELGEGYTIDNGVVISTGKSAHIKDGASWNVPASTILGNVRNDGTMNVGTKLTVATLVNNNVLNLNAGSNIVNGFANNANVWVNDEDAIATIAEGRGNININSATQTASNLTIKYVVACATQTGHFYAAIANVASVENAEKISWIKEFHADAVVDFTKEDLVSKAVDINTFHIKGATFNDVKTFDMKNITLDFGLNDVVITGTSLSQTTVKNVNINTNNRVVFQDIAALGTSTGYGELYADGVCATWNGEAVGIEALVLEGTTYTVNTRAGLKKIAEMVNGGNTLSGYTVKLANDIDLNNSNWTPIGNSTEQTIDKHFAGTFDGNGKIIKNLTVKNKNIYAGLFGAVQGDAVIKNVTIEGATIEGGHCVGAVIGQAAGNTIVENCLVNNASIVCTWMDAENNGDKAGVIVGLGNLATGTNVVIKNCVAKNSTVSASRDAGQIVGAATAESVTGCTVENVKVSANGTGAGKDEKTGQNINDDIVGRKF